MKLNDKWGWFLGFTAVFAVLAAFVFWGTWSPDFAPVMPDHPTTYSPYWLTEWGQGWLKGGMFVPGDLFSCIGGPYVALELKYVLSVFFAALGVAYFCRGRGLSHLASYGAALLLAFSGYWLTLFSAGHYGWFQWMTYGVFAFGLVDRGVGKDGKLRHWLLLGACVAWGSFYQPDMWLLFTAFTGVYFIYRLICERAFPWKGILLSAVTFALIAAPSVRNAFVNSLEGRKQQIAEGQTVGPTAKTGDKQADDAEKQWIFATNWSLPADETAEFFCRRLNGDTSCQLTLSIGMKNHNGIKPYVGALGRPKDAPKGNYRQHSLYVGIVTCLLALCGVVFGIRGLFNRTAKQSSNRTILFFALAAFVFWLFSLGRNCECVYRLVYALPFGDYLRAPVKWHHLTELCLAILAAYGIEALASHLSRVSSLKPFVLPIVGAVVLIGAIDLASVAKLYCAPYSVERARRTGSSMQMTVMTQQQLQHPQAQAMAREGKMVTLSTFMGNPNYRLVGVLNKFEPPKPLEKGDVKTGIVVLGVLSLLMTLGVSIYGISIAARPRNVV